MTTLPPHSRGLRIGLLGGSFNPAHAAHRAASLLALKRLGLDAVWWLVTPGNPLKRAGDLPPLAARVAAATALADHPRIYVTGLEAAIGTRYTVDTLAWLSRRCPGTRFVWLMGADNLAQFARWKSWRRIATLVPIAVVDRGGVGHGAIEGRAAQALARWRRPEWSARALPGHRAPAWVFLHGLKSPISSTALRSGRQAARPPRRGG